MDPLHMSVRITHHGKVGPEQKQGRKDLPTQGRVEIVKIILDKNDINQFPKKVRRRIEQLNPKFLTEIGDLGLFLKDKKGNITREVSMNQLSASEKDIINSDRTNPKYSFREIEKFPSIPERKKPPETAEPENLVRLSDLPPSAPPAKQPIQFLKDVAEDYTPDKLSEIGDLHHKYFRFVESKNGRNDIFYIYQFDKLSDAVVRQPDLEKSSDDDVKKYISRVEQIKAEKILYEAEADSGGGAKFLIRPSSVTNALTVSVIKKGDITHIRLNKISDGKYGYENREYNLSDIVKMIKEKYNSSFIDVIGFQPRES